MNTPVSASPISPLTPASPPTPGTLYLVPAPLDFGCPTPTALNEVLPERTLAVAAGLNHWICENAKSTRAYLKRIHESHPLSTPLQAQHIQELPHQVHKKGDQMHSATDAKALLQPALQGHDMGLVSEAGMPAIADPGSAVVRAAHDAGIPVVALVGPVSLLLALAASGLNGQNFAFTGYLPQDAAERIQRIKALESLALKNGQTQLLIETPYRNAALWQALLNTLQSNTRLSVSTGISLPQGQHQSHLVKTWKQSRITPAFAPPTDQADAPTTHLPAVFAIGR